MTPPAQTPGSVAVGARLKVRIEDVAFGGEGVARVDELVVFVPFVIVGEEAEVEITEVKKNFARAKLLQVCQPSSHRVAPRCPHFGLCGGCQYQHIDYSAQLECKRKQVADLFERLGRFPGHVVAPVVPCPTPYGYRNRIMVRSQWNKPKQGLDIGYLRHDCGLLVDVEECCIAEPALNEQLRQIRAHPPPRGGLKVVLRLAPGDWDVPPDSFFQNNFHLLPGLVRVVRERLVDAGTRGLADAYCGVGFFSLELADLVERFVGIEYDRMAVKAARRNAARRGAGNGAFSEGMTEELLPQALTGLGPTRTTVILDPPRRGCARVCLDQLREIGPAQVIYVSCHPATLARDLNTLCADGVFELKTVVPLDMFPQTQHVECVADVRLRA